MRTTYTCGCEAGGDNVSSFCPQHGKPAQSAGRHPEMKTLREQAKELSKLKKAETA